MSYRVFPPLAALSIMIAVVLCAPVRILGQASKETVKPWAAPRTSWGDPDFQGLWENNSATPMQRPLALAGKQVLSDQELSELNASANEVLDGGDAVFGGLVEAALRKRDGTRAPGTPGGVTGTYNQFWVPGKVIEKRTSLIVDPPEGRVPAMTPEAQKLRAEKDAYARAHPADSWVDRNLYERCITRGLPGAMVGTFYNHNYHIFQSPEYVVILVEMIHDARIIPIDGRPHIEENVRQWMGDSRGRWEGNTLVVETTNFNHQTRSHASSYDEDQANTPLIERFTRIDRDTIDYSYSINDPTIYTRPWTVSIPMKKTDGQVYEYACHEGNVGMFGILNGHRAQENAAAAGR